MSTEDDARRDRAALRRAELTLRKTDLEHAHLDLHPVRGAEAISLVSVLTRESWALGSEPYPGYERHETPYRFVAHCDR